VARAGRAASGERPLPIAAIGVEGSHKSAPLGAAMVALAANRAASGRIRAYVEGIDAREAPEAAAARLLDGGPVAIGFSLYSWSSGHLRDVARLARRASPGTFLFAGGPEASANPRPLLKDFDAVVIGQGEAAAAELASALASGAPREGLRGIRSAPVELQGLGSAYAEGLLTIERGGGMLLERARGCPFSCSYC